MLVGLADWWGANRPGHALVTWLAALLLTPILTACALSATDDPTCAPPPGLQGAKEAQVGSGPLVSILGATAGYVIRDSTVTLVGLCGLASQNLPDKLPKLIDGTRELPTIGVTLIGDLGGSADQLVLVYPQTEGNSISVVDTSVTTVVGFARDLPASACDDPGQGKVTKLRCGIAMVYKWSTAIQWDPEDVPIGVGIDPAADGQAGLSLVAPTNVAVIRGRIVLEIALIGADFKPAAGEVELIISDIYSSRTGRSTLKSPVSSGSFRVG